MRAIRYSTQKNLDLGEAVGGAVVLMVCSVLFNESVGTPTRVESHWKPIVTSTTGERVNPEQSSVARGRGLGRKANSIATA